MIDNLNKSAELYEKDFQSDIDSITNRRLTPQNLESYADDALNDLIDVVGKVVETYKKQPTISSGGKEDERAAFSYYGLDADSVEQTLDLIASKAETIHGLNATIEKLTTKTNRVITPPTDTEHGAITGSGEFHQNQYVPRLQTILLLLENNFGVDISNPDEVSVLRGIVTDEMMRQEPYHLVTIPAISRNVLVCNEESNATFVLDSKELERLEIPLDKLISMDKDELSVLLNKHPVAGRRLTHSKYFTERFSSLLEEIPAKDNDIVFNPESAKLLALKEVPEDFLSRPASAKELGVSHDAIKKATDILGDALGEVVMAKYRGRPARVYTPEQRAIIKQWLTEHDFYAPQIPEGYLGIDAVAKELSVAFNAVHKAIDGLGESIGEPARVRKKNIILDAYSPQQIEMIRSYLVEIGKLTDDEPEGYLTVKGLSKVMDASRTSILKAIKEVEDELGEVRLIKAFSSISNGYSPAQQEIIRKHLQERGVLAERAPEGYLTEHGFRDASGYSKHAVNKALEVLADRLGEIRVGKIGYKNARAASVYSPRQQDMMAEWLKDNGYKTSASAMGSAALHN